MLASFNTTTSTPPSTAYPCSSLFSQDVVMAHETFGPMDIDQDEVEDIVMAHETFGPMDIDQDEDVVMAHETFAPMDWMWT